MATPDIMCETLKMTVDELLRQNHLAICQMPKDGLCLILACAEALNVSKEHIVERLNSELAQHRSAYEKFLVADYDVTKELDRYLKKGIYNSDIGDVCVSALANAIGAKIEIYQELDGRILRFRHEPSRRPESQPAVAVPKTICLLRSGSEEVPGNPLHFDALLAAQDVLKHQNRNPGGKSGKNSMVSSVSTPSAVKRSVVQMSIRTMFKKPRTEVPYTEACSTPTTAQTNSSHPIPSTSCMESVSQTTATHSSMSETVKILSTPQSSVAETSTLSQLPVSQSTDYVTVPVTPTTSVLPSVVQCPLESASATTEHSTVCTTTRSTSDDDDEDSVTTADNTCPKVCRNKDQFSAWTKSRDWLYCESGAVRCSICIKAKKMGGVKTYGFQGQREEGAFITGKVDAKSAKTLLKKIDRHRESKLHIHSADVVQSAAAHALPKAVDKAQALFELQHKANIEKTEIAFRTAYECAKSNLSFAEYSRLMTLQSVNGLNTGDMLVSNHSCINIVEHIASEMRSELIHHIVANDLLFSVMIDESTSVGDKQSMIIYIRTELEGEVQSFFLGLVPISSGTAIDLHILLMNYLESVGLTDAICSKQLVGFCSDGASTMIGNYRGTVATLLKEKFPRVQSFHCMAHRLELAIKNAVDSVNGVSHFKIFIDSLYKFYSLSPKNQRELASIAADTNTVLLKINKIFEVRWAFSSFLSMKALLRDYCALHAHLLRLSENGDRSTKEASKCKGLANKMSSWIFVSQLCMLKDSLRTLKQLSLFFQSNDANLVSATMKIAQAKASLLAMKEFPGKSLKNMWDMCDSTGSFKGVLLKRTDTDFANFTSLRSQFYQCLLDNIAERFPCTETLKLANVLNPTSWPTDDLEKTLYGCREVAALCKQLCFSSIASVEILSDFATFKDNLKVGMHLKQLLTKLSIYPISSADCERGFSSMNLQHTDTRNRLKTETVSALLMIAVNGPAVQFFKCHEYVLSWFKKGRHGANDKPTGKKRNVDELRPRYKLFAMIKD